MFLNPLVGRHSCWFLIVYLATNAEGLDKVNAAVQEDMKSTPSCKYRVTSASETLAVARDPSKTCENC